MSYGGGPWNPGDSIGGPWTVRSDSTGLASAAGSGVELDGTSGVETIEAGPSLGDLDLTVTANVGSTGALGVRWHGAAAGNCDEVDIGLGGWLVSSAAGSVDTASGTLSLSPGDQVVVHIVSTGGGFVVSLDGFQISTGSDGSSGDIGVVAAGADLTVTNVALSS